MLNVDIKLYLPVVNIFQKMPTKANNHINENSNQPLFPCKRVKVIGVYDPAIKIQIEIMSNMRNLYRDVGVLALWYNVDAIYIKERLTP